MTTLPRQTTSALDTEATKRIFSKENLARLVELVRPYLEPDKRKLVYVFPASGRIGHIAQEPHALHCLYGDQFDELLMVIHDRRMMPVSEGTFETASQYVRFVETRDRRVVQLGHFDGGRMGDGPMTLLLMSPIELLQTMQKRFHDHAPPPFTPPADLVALGDAWLDRLGLAAGDPVVTVHVRDTANVASLAYHGFRAADLSTYDAAIGRLLDTGHAVFRLGDRTSPRLEIDHPRLFDVPFRDDYADWMDVFLIHRSRFMLCCPSGPEALARVLGVPMLKVNAITENFVWNNDGDVLMFRHYVREADGVALSYRQILESGLSWFSEAKEFEERGIVLPQNSAEEILAAVDEMLARLDGGFVPDPAIDARFRAIGEAFLARIDQNKPERAGGTETVVDAFTLASPLVRCSQAFCRLNPHFLAD